MTLVIETEGLTKTYGRSRGIEDVSLAIGQGAVFGFLGPNGAGKTTTIRTLLGLLHPTAGHASVFGLDVRRDAVAIRARLGNLPGDFAFDDRVTGAELLDLLEDLRGVIDRSYISELADRFHADLSRPLGDLSRGNRQKIGIIQALAHRPELVMMDEPTSGLDPLMQEEFDRLIAELRADGTTVFLSSHNLTEVEGLCDRVGIMREGKLVAEQTVAEMPGRSLRRVTLVFDQPIDTDALSRLPGVRSLHTVGARVSFTLAGDLDEVLRFAAARHVVDMEITRSSLEDAFLAFYGVDGAAGR
jgi:ABC-2 type transport system ATP-binding protein